MSKKSYCFLLFLIVSITPFLSIFAHNTSILNGEMLITTIPFLLANILFLYLFSFLLGRFINREKAISLTVLSLYVFYFYTDMWLVVPDIQPFVPTLSPLTIYLSLLLFLYCLFISINGRLSLLFFTFFTFTYVASNLQLLVSSASSPAMKAVVTAPPKVNSAWESYPHNNITFKHKPNVYIITVDGYGREDMLKKHLDFDNDLIPYLEENGYAVIENSHSNYPLTFLSLSSTFAGSYLFTEGYHPFKRKPLYDLIGGYNPIANVFDKNGYLLVQGEGGAHNVANCSYPRSICIRKSLFNVGGFFYEYMEKFFSPELLGVILNKTPLYLLNNMYVNHRIVTIDQLIHNIHTIRKKNVNNQPIYMYAYTIPPHPPFIFNPDCSLKRVHKELNLGDSKDKEGYLDNLKCTNKTIKNFVEYIKENDPNAIVVFFSDHGTDFTVDWKEDPAMWSKESVEERMSNFIAIKLPESGKGILPNNISNINIFPYLFRYLTGEDVKLYEDHFYITIYENTPFEGKFVEKHLR